MEKVLFWVCGARFRKKAKKERNSKKQFLELLFLKIV